MSSETKPRDSRNQKEPFPLVVVGASAGGLAPFERFLSILPKKFGFAVVFMQHLSPEHTNLLPELLRSRTKRLDIEEASEGLHVVPGKVYLCPPASEVRVEKDTFRVALRSRQHLHFPIDELLVSLSEGTAERTIAIILSGAGTDGARGAQAIRTLGGTVFVQDPATAEYPAMPLAAINTGQIDGILTPEEIATETLKFQRLDIAGASDHFLITPVQFDSLHQIVNERTGCHFNHYKSSVITRRLRRRMYLHGINSVDGYLGLLAQNEQEAGQLASDLLIGVTSFFRDRLAWKALHLEVTRKLVVEEDTTPIRVWAAACATGEEAYSVAMLLQHEFDMAGRKREIHIFATDVNDRALERAREGTYPASILADLPPDYLRTYFSSSEDGLSVTVTKEIRQRVIFAKQDILTDPPFSRLDLIICRNLLIYLEPDAQERCISLFHYALKKGGYLFLGNAESPGRTSALFASLAHKKCRIYRKTEAKHVARIPLSIPFASEHSPLKQKPDPEPRPSATHHLIQEALLEEYAPAAVAINQNHDILYHNGPTNRFLRQPRGTPTQNLLELIPEKLRNRMRGSLYRVAQDAKPITVRTSIILDERKKQVLIRITRVRENLFLLTFRETGSLVEDAEPPLDAAAIEETAVYQLEHELAATRDELQSNIEELKSVNEELESSNEELQAANEELETSREELQSLNEELTTVNGQLQTKIEEQEGTNNDLNNLLTSTNIPTIFLDHHFRVKRFTPAMSKLISLIPADEGRSITDMSRENLGPDLIADARTVLDNLTPLRREIPIDGAWYERVVLPYRTMDNRIEGVVITYTDFTERKLAEERIVRAKEEWERTFDSVPDMIAIIDNDHRIRRVNKSMARRLGLRPEQCIGIPCYEAVHGTSAPPPFCPHAKTVTDGTEHVEEVHESRLGGDFVVSTTPLRDEQGRMIGAVHVAHDITERKQTEKRIRHLASFPEMNPNPVMEISSEGAMTFRNAATQTALEEEGLEGKEVSAFLPGDMDTLLGGWDGQTDVIVSREVTIGARIFDEAIHLVSGFNVARIYARDITARKQAEEALARARTEAELRAAEVQALLEVAPVAIWMAHDPQCLQITGNRYADEVMQAPPGANISATALPGHAAVHFNVFQDGVEMKPEELPAQIAAATGKPVATEIEDLIFSDGRVVTMIVGAVPLFDAEGRVRGSVAAGVDITLLKRTEEALLESRRQLAMRAAELEAVNKDLEAFSYTVSNDLKTPLRSIQGFATAISDDYRDKLDDKGRDFLHRITSAVERMTQLIDSMLAMSRLTGRDLISRSVNLSSLAEMVAHELTRKEPDRRVKFAIAKGVKGHGDADMLEVVLKTLFDNAWKFASKHASANIEFGVAEINGRTAYFVRDDGAGFDMEFADKLFMPFRRMHPASQFPGLGIGLATARKIINKHDGVIWAEGAPEKGATFYFTLGGNYEDN